MAQQTIVLGAVADDGTGDPLRTAGGKINANFSELFADEGLIGNRTVMSVVPYNFATTQFATSNIVTPTAVGTAVTPNFANTNERTRRRRVTFSTGAASNTSAGTRILSAIGYRGDATGRGGFTFRIRFALNLVPSGFRAFIGLLAATNAPNGSADPSALTDMIGLGKDAADSAWSLMHNDSSGSAVKDTAVAAISIAANAVLELSLSCVPGNGSNISYEVKEVTGVDASGNDTFGTPVTGTISSELPTTLTQLYSHMYINTAAGSSDARIDFLRANAVILGE